jgi:citrate lyase subunit beta/citryl-CoA lyase
MNSWEVSSLTTMLFVPACRPRMVEKARGLTAAAVILDLEDGAGLGEKESARAAAVEVLGGGWPERPRLFVRVNGIRTPYFQEDVAAIAPLNPLGVCVPKCESALDVRVVVAELERWGSGNKVRLVPFVETAHGVVNAFEVASASDHVVAIALGSEDLAADMGLRRTRDGAELAYHRSAVATAARAAGVMAIDGVFIDLGDADGLAADAASGRAAGFSGKQVIHPSQIDPVARAFAPTPLEVAWATRVVEAFERAESEGSGVVVVDGNMVDRPVVLRARRLLDAAGVGRSRTAG